MSQKKQQVRAAFRDATFKQSNYRCICCGLVAPKDKAEDILDAHHITNRNEFPNGGYVKENGASLCKNDKPNERSCHFKAEEWLANGAGEDGYDPATLYSKIGSNQEKAFAADARL
jgi:hypothetical protein